MSAPREAKPSGGPKGPTPDDGGEADPFACEWRKWCKEAE